MASTGQNINRLYKSKSMVDFPHLNSLMTTTEPDKYFVKKPNRPSQLKIFVKKKPLTKSKSMVDFSTLQDTNNTKPVKNQEAVNHIPMVPQVSGMADFSPEADSRLVNQLYKELKKVRIPSVREEDNIEVYKRRWYILILFSLLAGLQAYIWNFWGPIAATSEHAYGWTDSDIAFYANWGPICFIPMVIPFSWLISSKGLRWALVIASGLVAVGSGLRCTLTDPPYNKWLVHSGHLLNGIAGPIGKGMGPVVSAVWFPPDHRTTATAIMSGFQWFAVGISCIAGPLAVPETFNTWNNTHWNNSVTSNTNITDHIISIERRNINYYLYGSFGVCATLFLVIIIYFPAKPPRPPSPSASVKRLDYCNAIRQLMRRRYQFWFVAVIYGSSTGIREAWSSMLNVNLKSHGITQLDSGWIGFYSSIAGWVAGIIVARFSDTFRKRFKLFLIILYFLSTLMYIWLTLTLVNILPSSKASLYASVIISSIVIGSTTPLFYELACEIAYPISEGISNLVLTMQANIASLIFLGVLSIPDIGTVWMNWLLVASFASCTVALLFMKEVYARSDVDAGNRDKTTANTITRG